jgi:NitT/TauT family transport system substrate-binding protein
MKSKLIPFCFLIFIAGFSSSYSQNKKVSFVPLWQPQSQFAGYYVAYELGMYKKYGIDLNIIPGGPNTQSSVYLENGKSDFALLWLSVAIQLKAKGAPIVNIAQTSHRSSVLIIAKKSSGIRTFEDMNDQKIAVWGGQYLNVIQPFLKKYSISARIIPIGATNNLFLLGGADITMGCLFNEYHTIINSGIDSNQLRIFPFADYGLNFAEDGIYCLESTFNKDPKLCSDFVKASEEGWQYAFENPEKALDIVMKYAKLYRVMTNRTHQRWMLERMKDLILSQGSNKINTILSREEYDFVGNTLKTNDLIKEVPKFEYFYRPCK